MEVESESTIGPNWLDLPRDLTENILQRLGTIEILMSACRVCPLWWNICKDPLTWRTIRISYHNSPPYEDVYGYLNRICHNALERSCNHLEDIDIEIFGTEDLLKCIVNNGSHLRCMRLELCRAISDEGFSEAVRKLPLLEKLDISNSNLTKFSLEVIGQSCPLLKSFKYQRFEVFDDPCDDMAFVIAETMSGLCHLDINGHELTNVGLLAILDKCSHLKSLYVHSCDYLDLSESLKKRCIDQLCEFQMSNRLKSYAYEVVLSHKPFFYHRRINTPPGPFYEKPWIGSMHI